MSKRKVSFKLVYAVYLLLLIAAVAAATLYVYALLRQYEASQPERHVQDAMAQLVSDADREDFWEKYDLPAVTPGKFERGTDLQKAYRALYTGGELDYAQKGGHHEEDELYYTVERDGFPLAEIKLRAAGPMVTKLAVFSMRDWTVEYVKPILEEREYTLSVPSDFQVRVNGVALTAADGVEKDGAGMEYTLSGLYLEPSFEIADGDGSLAEYTLRNGKVMAEFYDYDLTLPAALTLSLNGQVHQGEDLGDGRVRHDITLLAKPVIEISDYYGNTVGYDGGDELPLTYMTVTASDRHTVRVSGMDVPPEAVTLSENPDYAHMADLVEGLPRIAVYDIAILEDDAEVTVASERGETVVLDAGVTVHDLTAQGLDAVPDEVSAQVDVLKAAQDWSLFMSKDLSFAALSQHLIPGSYQYDSARRYSTSIDITFTSSHSLLDPAFTGNSVTNFVWITDTCFSVDIRFVKHMLLGTGVKVDDPMNDRFYFVKYDGTNDNVDNPAWKLAGMKEIVDDAGE